jgi:PPOX class probable F420-dependent enzyme
MGRYAPRPALHDPEELVMGQNSIPDSHLDLFRKKAFANLATVMPNGSPQVTPVWVDYDGQHVLINTAQGRQKDKNLQRDGRVALSIMDPENPYRYLEVRGHVMERTHEGADQHIDAMANKYLGQEKYPYRQAGEVRVLYKVAADRCTFMG